MSSKVRARVRKVANQVSFKVLSGVEEQELSSFAGS